MLVGVEKRRTAVGQKKRQDVVLRAMRGTVRKSIFT